MGDLADVAFGQLLSVEASGNNLRLRPFGELC